MAAHPGRRAVQAGRDALRLPGQLHGAGAVAADTGDQAQDRQGQRLGNRVITVPGQGQGSAGIAGRLGDPSHAEQRRRPAAQAPGQQRERPAVPDGVADRGEVAQRPGRIGRIQRRLTEPGVTGAPRVAARGGAVDGRAQQRHLTREPAADLPPPRQRGRQPRCHGGIAAQGRIVLHGPVQHLAHGGVLGIQPPGSGHLAGAGRSAPPWRPRPPAARTGPPRRQRPRPPRPPPAAPPRRLAASPASHTGTGHPGRPAAGPAASSPPDAARPARSQPPRPPRLPPA